MWVDDEKLSLMANSIRLECLIVTGITCSKWVASIPLVSVAVNQFGILCTTYRRLDPLIIFAFRLIECVDFCQSQIHNLIDLSFVTQPHRHRFFVCTFLFLLLQMFCRERAAAKRGFETLFYVNIWCSTHTESEVNEVVDSFSRFLENTRSVGCSPKRTVDSSFGSLYVARTASISIGW